jgi:CheY-like chemotaxis protein
MEPPAEGPTLPERPAPVDRSRLVLVADSDIEAGKRTAAAVASWGLQPMLVHDGVEAMLTIQRMLPAAVVLDAALPKMFGFQICEVVKRNEALRDTHVVLIGAIHHRDRYRRPPSDLYGADVYIERPVLPEGLVPVLRRFGLPLEDSASAVQAEPSAAEPAVEPPQTPAPRPEPVAEPRPAPVAESRPEPVAEPTPAARPRPKPAVDPALPTASRSEPASDGLDDERAKAERLARIIVSDIVLYNADEFAAGVRGGNVLEAMEPALQEGRELFRQRIDERVRSGRSYLEEELMRVARERGAT